MKKKILLTALLTGAVVGLYAQNRGTPSTLRVTVDANGALLTAIGDAQGSSTICTFSNCRLATDSNGALLTSISGGLSLTFPFFINGSPTYQVEQTGADWVGATEKEMVIESFTSNNTGSVLALQNKASNGCDALTGRDDNNRQKFKIGYCNSDYGLPTLYNSSVVIEASSGNPNGGQFPKFYFSQAKGSVGGVQYFPRQLIDIDGSIKWWQLIESETSQVISMSLLPNGGLGIGLQTPLTILHLRNQNSLQAAISSDQYSDDTVAPALLGRKARGTVASPAQINSGDTLLQVAGYGLTDGLTWPGSSASIDLIATEAPTSTARGGRIDFSTVTPTTTTSVVRFKATAAGLEFVGTAPSVANVGANSCGTSAASVVGNNNAGRVTVGATSGTQCRVTTTFAAANTWEGSCSNTTTAVLCRFIPVSASTFDLVGVFTAADVLSFVAMAR